MNVRVHKAVEPEKCTKAGKAAYAAVIADHARRCLMPKLDGVYVQLVPDSAGDYHAFTRQGEPMLSIPQSTLDLFRIHGQQGRVYIGEVWMVGVPHSEINGKSRKQKPQDALQVWLHDSYMPHGFGEILAEDYRTRWGRCEQVYNGVMAHNGWQVSLVYPIEGLETCAATTFATHAHSLALGYTKRASAYDGCMLVDWDHLFTEGSGKDGGKWKIKPRPVADLRVVGTTAGKGKHAGRLGALVVALGNGIECKVNLGTDEDRERTDWIGSIVQVSYLSIGANGGLREPVFMRRRDDKTEADVIHGAA